MDEALHPHPIPFWLLSKLSPPGYDPPHSLLVILSTGTPGSKDDIPDTYVTVHTQFLWVHEVWEGNSVCIPSCRAQAFSDEGCFLRRSLLEFLLGLGANPLPMLRLGGDFSSLLISVLPPYQTLLLPRTFALFIEKTKAMGRNSTNMQSDLCIMSC